MIVKIKLSTGKEIELTKQEFDELRDSFREIVYQTFSETHPRPNLTNPVLVYAAP